MPVIIRPLQGADARRFIEVHHQSVRGLAENDYPQNVIEAWAAPITDERLQRFLQNRDGEMPKSSGSPATTDCVSCTLNHR